MEYGSKTYNRLIKWILIFGIWTLVAFIVTTQQWLQSFFRPTPDPFWRVFSWHLASCYAWFLMMPLIFWLAGKFPLEESRFFRNLFIHSVCGMCIVIILLVCDSITLPFLGFPPNRPFASLYEIFRFQFAQLPLSMATYCTVMGITFGTRYYRQFRDRELKAAQLEARLSQARMHVLKMQLHPHFLFNTHNAISVLIYKDPEAAEKMLGNLSDLLRLSLDKLEIERIPLQQELDFLNKYVEIEQTRFQDRLRVKFTIEPQTYGALVPNMILQPLVENAIKHGIAPRASGGTIEITAVKTGDNLKLEVADDGIGVPFGNPAEIFEGIGLSNTRARLEYLYGDAHTFDITPNEGVRGLRLKLIIPFTEEAALGVPQSGITK